MSKPKKYGLESVQKRQDDSSKLLLIAAEIEKARQLKTYVAYLDIAKLTGLFSGGSPLARLLGILFEMDVEAELAPRTALVVHRTDGVWGEPGKGFFEMCEKHDLISLHSTHDILQISRDEYAKLHKAIGSYQGPAETTTVTGGGGLCDLTMTIPSTGPLHDFILATYRTIRWKAMCEEIWSAP